MTCDCRVQPTIRHINGTVQVLFPNFKCVDTAHWKALLRCPVCGQLWSVDEWDKYQIQFAVKINTQADWKVTDDMLRKAHLAQARGGEADAACMWNGCGKRQLKGSAYCVDHLYTTGART